MCIKILDGAERGEAKRYISSFYPDIEDFAS